MFAASKSGQAVSAVVTDPYFMYVPLLLNTTSTNGQQNNTFLDSSTNNFTITRNGTPTQGAFTPYQPSGYWSGVFNGSSDYLSAAYNAAFNFASSTPFTVEFWFNTTGFSGAHTFVSNYNGATTGWTVQYRADAGNVFRFSIGNTVILDSSAQTVVTGTWYHLAVVRNASNSISMYLNGVSIATPVTNSNAFAATSQGPWVGGLPAVGQYYPGYISNLRIVNGTAVYTSAFTPPTTPLTAITNTSLLTLQSNRFIDNSTNAFAITVNGTPKVQAFQPFSPAASYSAATYGGSGYFGGSDSLNLATNAIPASGAFTFETFVYVIGTAASQCIIAQYPNGTATGRFQILWNDTSNKFTAILGSSNVFVSDATYSTNTWLHLVVQRDASNIWSMYVNGTRNTSTVSNSTAIDTAATYIGNRNTGGTPYTGYISNLRVVSGTAVYSGSTITVPTSPVTAVSGTSLLTNFTNAGIYDAAWQNNALTVGDAQSSISQYKWSPTSMRFDGTGDYLTMPLSAGTTITSGNFTVEFWLYPSTVVTALQAIVGTRESDSSTSINWSVSLAANQLLFQAYDTSNTLIGTLYHQTTLSAGNWYYCAWVRSGSTFTLYVNGVASATTITSSATIQQSGTTLWVGRYGAGSIYSALNGYIQDLRITKGVARTITTPTAAFPTR